LFVYVNFCQDTKLEQEINSTFKNIASDLIFLLTVSSTLKKETYRLCSVQFPAELTSKVNAYCQNTSRFKLITVVVHAFKHNKPHYVVYIKSGINWIKLDDEEVKNINQKTVLEACGDSGGDRYQSLASMLVYSSPDDSPDILIPTHLQDRY